MSSRVPYSNDAPTGHPHTSPGCNPGYEFIKSLRSEGTPHIPASPILPQSIPMPRSFRAHSSCPTQTRGSTPGWYAPPPWGKNHEHLPQRGTNHASPPQRGTNHASPPQQGTNHASLPQRGIRIPAQGATLGISSTTYPRSEGTPHTSASPTRLQPTRMPRSFRAQSCHPFQTRGYTPGWYAPPPWGHISLSHLPV